MQQILKFVFSATLTLTLLASPSNGSSAGELAPEERSCTFRRGGLPATDYCAVSIYRLVSQPEIYADKQIFTIGYLMNEGGAIYSLAPDEGVFDNSDFLSCVKVIAPDSLPRSDEWRKRQGIYSVEVAGRFALTKNGSCVGTISGAIVEGARFLREL